MRSVFAFAALTCVACAVGVTDDSAPAGSDGTPPMTGGGGCPTAWQICSMKCVDARTDPKNCGLCGRVCQNGTSCQNGQCAPTEGCPSSTKLCGSQCIDTSNDTNNCGSCNNMCGGGMTCVSGQCVVDCQAPQKNCNGTCVDTTSDDGNCGMCGNACPQSSSCMAGVCACMNALILCSNSCVDTQSDNANCGMCGTACSNGQQCVGGTCKSAPAKVVVFVTSQTWTGGNLGGLSGADTKCQTLAQASSVTGTFKAWLSDSKISASGRLAHWQSPYVLVDGSTQVASDWNALTGGSVSHAIDHNEKNSTSSATVWTNTNTNGSMYSGSACGDWANTSGTVSNFHFGMATSSAAAWTLNSQSTYTGGFCGNLSAALYCIQQ